LLPWFAPSPQRELLRLQAKANHDDTACHEGKCDRPKPHLRLRGKQPTTLANERSGSADTLVADESETHGSHVIYEGP